MPLATYCLILGVVEILFAVPMLVRPQQTAKWFLELKNNDPIIRIVSAPFLIMGILVLSRDASVGFPLAGLARLLVWLICVKSLILSWWLLQHARIAEKFLTGLLTQYLAGVVAAAWGLLFLMAAVML